MCKYDDDNGEYDDDGGVNDDDDRLSEGVINIWTSAPQPLRRLN